MIHSSRAQLHLDCQALKNKSRMHTRHCLGNSSFGTLGDQRRQIYQKVPYHCRFKEAIESC